VQEVFGLVKRNLSEAQRRKDAPGGERGAGKGAAALVPASAHSGQERASAPNRKFLLADQSGLTRLVNPAPLIVIYPGSLQKTAYNGRLSNF
jgi:hypothetical protein